MELLTHTRLQTILDHAEIGTWEWDLRTAAAIFDARAKAILGYPPHAEVNDVGAWEAAIHPEDAPAAAAKLRRHLAAPQPEALFEVEHRVRHTETDFAWVSLRGQVIERDADGRALRMMGIVQDISAHKADHAEIARQNQVLEAVREAQAGRIEGREPSEVFEGLLGVLLHATQSGYGFIGEAMYRPDGVRYLKTHAITNIAWDDASRAFYDAHAATGIEFHNLRTLFGVVLTSEQAVFANDPANDPRRGGLPTGHPPLNQFFGVPLHRDGRFIGMIGLANRAAGYDDALLALIAPLVSTASSLLHSLMLDRDRRNAETALRQAQKLESLGLLAGGVAHDFNNLLTAILGNLNLAQLQLGELSPAAPYLRNVEEATQKAADLAKQMLAYSGRGRFVVQPVDLNEAIEAIAHLLEVAISKKIALRFQLATALPAIEGDASQLQQIVMNLVTNAAEAIVGARGTITLSTNVADVDADYLARNFPGQGLSPGRFAIIEVADDGVGIPQDVLGRIFDPFYSTKATGRGLGLSALLGIVRSHRGAIRVYTELGKGTTFRLLFPASDRSANPRRASGSAELGQRYSGTVLVVDDEPAVRAVLERMLRGVGFSVLTASDGEEGVAMYRAHQQEITLVIMDLTMPKLDGKEAFRAIRGIGAVPVLLMSGYSEHDAVHSFIGRGLAGFLQKPFTLNAVREALREALHESVDEPAKS